MIRSAREASQLRTALALTGALALHAAVAAAARPLAIVQPTLAPVEVELQPPAPPPVPEEHVEPPAPKPEPAPAPAAAPRARATAPAPAPAARAGSLLTAAPEAARSDEILDFVTDPSGATYGSGNVMRGATAAHAEGNVAPTAPRPTAAPARGGDGNGDVIVAPEHLSRRARLGADDPCRGFFPRDADSDSAEVAVVVVVRPNGAVASASIASESPRGQGFGLAARRCLLAQRFDPALDDRGQPATSAPTVKVRFTR